jgi:hypothetical protein
MGVHTRTYVGIDVLVEAAFGRRVWVAEDPELAAMALPVPVAANCASAFRLSMRRACCATVAMRTSAIPGHFLDRA